MSTQRQAGRVVMVSTELQGAVATSWVGGNLSVYNGADFDREGGQFTLELDPTTVYDYTGMTEGLDEGLPDVVTTAQAAPLGLPADEFRVNIYPPAVDCWAEVEVADAADAILAVVPHSLRAQLRDGVREDNDREWVELELRGFQWVIADVIGRPVELAADAVTFPAEPGEAPVKLPQKFTTVEESMALIEDAAAEAVGLANQAKADAATATGYADQATQDAAAALASANGKNAVKVSTGTPSGNGSTDGDLWIQTNTTTGHAIGQWAWNGSQWIPRPITSEMITYLDVHKLTVSGSLGVDLAVAQRIVADFAAFKLLTADKLVVAGTNLLADPYFGSSLWDTNTTNRAVGTTGTYGDCLQLTGSGPNGIYYGNSTAAAALDVSAGTYKVSVWVHSSLALTANDMAAVYLTWGTSSTAGVNTFPPSSALTAANADTLTTTLIHNKPMAADTWTLLEAVLTVPADVVKLTLGCFSQATAPTGAVVAFRNPTITRMASGELIVDGAIDGKELNGVDIYSPSSTALPRVHVGGSVLEVIRNTDSEGAPVPAIRIGGAGADQIMLYGADGNPLAGIDPAGNGIFCDVNVAGGLSLGGRNIIEYMAENYAYGLLTANSATADTAHFGSGELGLWGLDCTLRGGRLYRIGFSGYASVATASAVQFFLRHTTRTANGDAAPTVSSLLMNSWISPASTKAGIRSVEGAHYIVGGGSDYRFLLSAKNATGNVDSYAYGRPASPFVFFVEDIGWADSSVMSNGYVSTGGGTPFSGTTTTAPATYTRIKTTETWASGWTRSWRGGAIVTDYLQQGYYGGYQRYSYIGGPPAMFTALAGSTVNLVEVFLQNRSFYNNSGGTVLLSPHGATSAPATYTAPGAQTPVAVSWPYGAGKWVTLPAAWNPYFGTGQYQGVVLGEGASTASTYYGKFDLAGSKFRVTYTK